MHLFTSSRCRMTTVFTKFLCHRENSQKSIVVLFQIFTTGFGIHKFPKAFQSEQCLQRGKGYGSVQNQISWFYNRVHTNWQEIQSNSQWRGNIGVYAIQSQKFNITRWAQNKFKSSTLETRYARCSNSVLWGGYIRHGQSWTFSDSSKETAFLLIKKQFLQSTWSHLALIPKQAQAVTKSYTSADIIPNESGDTSEVMSTPSICKLLGTSDLWWGSGFKLIQTLFRLKTIESLTL